MKDCLIIGPTTALMYNDVYPLLRDKVLTVTERSVDFYEDTHQEGNWFATLVRSVDMRRRQLTKTYNPDDYPRYDNAPEIIECTNKKDIPIDYQDKIGVPITFFYYYPELDYEILEYRGDLKLNGKNMFARLIIRRKQL
jgi:hypothetical protein